MGALMQAGRATRKISVRALAPWQMRRAIQLLQSAIGADCPVQMLARACGVSHGHFAHAFKISTGLPPHRWLLRLRIQRAREMMERTKDSLSAIALSCGFADQSHFTRAFRAATGMTPARWRRERQARVTAAERELAMPMAITPADIVVTA